MKSEFRVGLLLLAIATPCCGSSANVAFTSQPDGAPMMLVPAGEFVYGVDRAEILAIEKRLKAPWDDRINPSEFGRKKLTLPAFYIDKFDVTNARYSAFVAATGHRPPRFIKYPQLNAPRQPVVGVGWADAAAYCAWSGKRLVTEPEWEKAARGTDGWIWPWGNEPQGHPFNGRDAGVGAPSEVGSFPESDSPFGVSDMAGNVWQITDGKWDADGHAMRGGSFLNKLADVRTTVRWSPGDEGRGTNWLGFRCAKSLPATEPVAVPITPASVAHPELSSAQVPPRVDQDVLLAIQQAGLKTKDLRISPPKESKQVDHARRSMGVPADETVLALLNATIFEDGDEGLILGTRALYYHTSAMRKGGPAVGSILYSEFPSRQFRAAGSFDVDLGNGQFFNVAKSSIKASELVLLLNRVKQALAGR